MNSFADFVRQDFNVMKIVGLWNNLDVLAEMARGTRTVRKIPTMLDNDDLAFLHQFPTYDETYKDDLWVLALKWRYGEGLLRVTQFWSEHGGTRKNPYAQDAQGRDIIDNYPEKETVDLWQWSAGQVSRAEREVAKPSVLLRVYRFKDVTTGIAKLWNKLQDPKGYDMDLTDMVRASVQERDALHRFNTTASTLQIEAARRNLKTWLDMTQNNVVKQPEQWNGQATQLKTVGFGDTRRGAFTVPAVQVQQPGYTVYLVSEQKRRGRKSKEQKEREARGDVANPVSLETLDMETLDRHEVPAAQRWVPVLSPGVHLKLVDFQKETLLKLLGIEPTTPLPVLVKMSLIEPTANPPRTAQNLTKIMNDHKDELMLSDAWVQKLSRYFQDAQFAKEALYGQLSGKVSVPEIFAQIAWSGGDEQDASRKVPMKQMEDWVKGMADLNVANLIIATNARYTLSAWRSPAKMSGRQLSGEHETTNLIANFKLLHDKHKGILRDYIPADEMIAAMRGKTKTDPTVVAGGFNLQKGEYEQIGWEEFNQVFNDHQKALLMQRHTDEAEKMIRRISDTGSVGKVNLSQAQIRALNNLEPEAIGYQAVLDPAILAAVQFDDQGKPTNAQEVAETFLSKKRIRTLIATVLSADKGIESIDSTISDEEGSETSKAANVTRQGALSDQGGLGKRRLMSGPGGTGGVKYATQHFKKQDTIYLYKMREKAIPLMNQLLEKQGMAQARTNIKALLQAAFKNYEFKTMDGQDIIEVLKLFEQGVSLQQVIAQIVGVLPDERITKQDKAETALSLDDAMALDDYEVPSDYRADLDASKLGQRSDQAKYRLKNFAQTLKVMYVPDGSSDPVNVDMTDDGIKTVVRKNGNNIARAKTEVVRTLYDLKAYFAKSLVSKDLMQQYWSPTVEIIIFTFEEVEEELKKNPPEEQKPTVSEPKPATTSPTVTTAAEVPPSDAEAKQIRYWVGAVDQFYKYTLDPGKTDTLRNYMMHVDTSGVTAYKKLPGLKRWLATRAPDAVNKIDAIIAKLATMGLKVEMSLPIGYPPYDRAKKDLLAKRNNAWGTAGPSATGLSVEEEPIKNWVKKRKTVKEYLESNKNQDRRLSLYVQRLQEKVNGTKP